MADRVLLDINVCLDVLLKRKLFWEDAAKIFMAAEKGQIQGWVSSISFDTSFTFFVQILGLPKHKKN
ncbi:MAG: hypothetical protein GVY20_00270 [Bacteroidetes bacterium]|nr:hypothetical protein [Bacteroidota bacterium]